RSLAPRICSYSVDLRLVPRQCLKCGCGRLATVTSKDEFVEVNLELGLAHSVVGPISHCWRLPIPRSASGTADFAPLRNSDRRGCLRATCLKPASESPEKLLRPSV